MTQLTHIQPADLGEADQALKTKHRAVWASTLSCPAWGSCSRRTTRLPRTNWSGSAARAARSV